MSGPIVRSGASEQYSSNWSKAFGEKKSAKKKTKASGSSKKKAAKKKKKS